MTDEKTTALPPTVAELEARMELDAATLTGAALARAKTSLEDATTFALAEVNRSKAATWEKDCPAVVRAIILRAARREMDNPLGLSNDAQGGVSVGVTESSGVYLTNREKQSIRKAATGRTGGFVGTIRTPSPFDRDPWPGQ